MRQILAAYDEAGIFVYQAFNPAIVAAALEKGTFGQGFSLERLTWIKPSFGWMLHRSGYASQHNQEAILKIKLSHDGFLAILGQAVETSHNPRLYADIHRWKSALDKSDVRIQWDPDRDLYDHRLERRAIQIGMRGETVKRYVSEWILGLEEVTELARAVGAAVKSKAKTLPNVPEERVYPVGDDLRERLGITGDS